MFNEDEEEITFIQDKTLYAIWEIEQYTVTFDSNRWTIVESQAVASWQKATQPTTTFPWYTLDGWFTDDEIFQNPFDFTGTEITGDITKNTANTSLRIFFVWNDDPATNLMDNAEDTSYATEASHEDTMITVNIHFAQKNTA